MYVFKSMANLQTIPPNHPCRGFVLKLVCHLIMDGSGYDPEADGYVVLLKPQDLSFQTLLPEVPLPLRQMPWEGVVKGQGLFHGVVLTNNQFAIDIIIPDAEWLSVDVRKSLDEHL